MAVTVIRKLRLLRDVVFGTPADGDVVTYDSGTDKFILAAPAGGGGGAPTTADYLVGTAQAGLSAEIVVGPSPGGELGGTWASPSVDNVHSGSSHAQAQAAAEATAAAALASHTGDTTDAHDASAISSVDAGGFYTGTDVEAILQEIAPQLGGGSGEATRKTISQTAHGFSVGDVLRISAADTYAIAQANSAANAEVAGIVVEVVNANSFVLHVAGYLDELSGLTAGVVYFLSPSSAGDLTATAPAAAGQVSKPLLVADGADSGWWFNWRGILVSEPAALDWQDVATGVGFNSDWANFGAPYGSVAYAKDAAKGLLYFRGVANPGAPTLAFTLPVGYRPSAQRIGNTFGDGITTPYEIKTNGEVDFYSNPGSSAAFDMMGAISL